MKLDLPSLRRAYVSGESTPTRVVEFIDEAIESMEPSAIWINRFSRAELQQHAARVEAKGPESQPLFGIPFAIKDNIDIAGLPTTAACPDFAYSPDSSSFVVQRLMDAGAIPVGKANLDQFATGLVGVRSPYGVPENPFHADFVPGGSSSGSAVAVARSLVSFSLGTDTAGSGRIPAAFNELVGLKPTRGILSCSGVVPACRSLDCVSIFANSAADAGEIFEIACGFDPTDSYARRDDPVRVPVRRIGVPREDQLEFFGDADSKTLFQAARERIEETSEVVEIDFAPFLEAARLLYEGPWVAERFVAIEAILKEKPEVLHPITRSIIEGGGKPTAAEAFQAEYRLRELKRKADAVFEEVDFVLTPTAGTAYTRAEVETEPVRLNSNLGYYTNFMNLLDFSAIAVPAGRLPNGVPFGVTLFAEAFRDRQLLSWAGNFLGESEGDSGPEIPDGWIPIVVCGAHLEGLALNFQLTSRNATLVTRAQTSANYRFYALPPNDDLPPRPGLVRDAGGASIEVEVWALTADQFGDFVAQIPSPLGIGKVEVEGFGSLPGFICEPFAIPDAEEITNLGGWREFLARS